MFAYRLALAVGRVDVDAMLAELTWPQLREWMAFYAMDPWGGERGDLGAAIVASTVANAMRGKGKAMKVSDFMPTFGEPQRKTPDQIASILKMAALAAKGAKK